MSEGILNGVRVIEGSAFVAAPTAGMTLAQLGADVIRFDDPRGGLDFKRWPLTSDGDSLFWSGLNKGKRSFTVDLRSDEGRESSDAADHPARRGQRHLPDELPGPRLDELRGAERPPPGPDHGRHERQSRRLVGGRLHGQPLRRLPRGDGPARLRRATNSLMPAWDTAMGGLAVVGLLAALRHRDRTGEGQLVKIALSDVAFATVGNLGRIAEVAARGPRPAARRQLPLRRLRRRLPDRRRAPRDGRRADQPPVEGAQGGHRHRGAVRERRAGDRATTSAARPAATRAAT